MRVLIAEDELISRRIIERILSMEGYEVVLADNGITAVEKLNGENAPRIAILDWMMPGMDGLQVCKHVRSVKTESYTYIILVTAKDRKDDIAKGLNAGADDYLTKPFDARELIARMQTGIRMLDLHDSLAEHVKRLEELDRLKSDFISMVSHDLKTPLAIIRGDVSLILDGAAGAVSDTQKDLLSDSLNSIDNLTRIITDVLDVSKIEAGKMKLRRKVMDLCAIIRKVSQDFNRLLEQKALSLSIEIPEREVKLFVDDDKMTQILNNLIGNAIQFTPEGGRITVRLEDRKDDVACSVSDTGIGISEQNLPKLFSKFTQLEDGRAHGRGTGLGLVIVKNLVEMHGGQIQVDSALGEGTTFTFTLRKTPFPEILVVDDERNKVKIIKRLLSADRYRFLEAYDGLEAVALARVSRPSLIVMDMMLPKITGYEVIERLRSDQKTKSIPILILSDTLLDQERIGELGDQMIVSVLKKPVKPDALMHQVKELVSLSPVRTS